MAKAKPKATPRRPETAPVPQADPRLVGILARQRADQIRELLPRARRAAEAGRLVEPANENAASLYQEVLS